MIGTTYEERRRLERLDRQSLKDHQLRRLNSLLAAIVPANRFYAEKLAAVQLPLSSLGAIAELPFTSKDELLSGPLACDHTANLTYPPERYVRYHRTSGTHGRPMVVLDTADDWQWWVDTWQFVLDAAELGPDDRVVMAFSFGPFIGFWSAHDAVVARGALVIPTGGMDTLSRLEIIRGSGATAVFCTPSYALRLAEVAADNNINLATLQVRKIVVAGEPGGSLPAVRGRIESAWNAKVIDHGGATEVGPWGYSDADGRGLHVVESEFIAEFHSVETGRAAGEGELSELVLTTLGRAGCPVIRYRTGDLVRPRWNSSGTNRFVFLEGGVLGRSDDMLIIRGVNVFPSSVEQIVRSFPEVAEYRMTVRKADEMDALSIEIEDTMNDPERVAKELRLRLGLRVDMRCVPIGSLPRFDGKGKRFVDERT
jgi:phenylacetate-CoA ligase